MPDELKKEPEPVNPDINYINTIEELKKNMVPRSDYDKAMENNKQLVDALANRTFSSEKEDEPKPKLRKSSEIMKDFNDDMTNLEFVETSLELREAFLAEQGVDIFVGGGHQLNVTQEDRVAAANTAQVYKECIEYAKGDSEVFTNELMRRTNDVIIPRRK